MVTVRSCRVPVWVVWVNGIPGARTHVPPFLLPNHTRRTVNSVLRLAGKGCHDQRLLTTTCLLHEAQSTLERPEKMGDDIVRDARQRSRREHKSFETPGSVFRSEPKAPNNGAELASSLVAEHALA